MRALSILLLIAGCHHDGAAPAAPISTADQDALWKLAPDGVSFGIVASPRSLAMMEHAWGDIRAFMGATPELTPLLVKIGAAVNAPDLSFAGVGLTATKGAALFVVGKAQGIAILPVADRDKFLAAVHGTKGETTDTLDKDTKCMTTHGVYACASDPALFERLGTGAIDSAAAGARGDIELAAREIPVDGHTVSFAAALQLSRGAVTMRGTIAGLPSDVLGMLGSSAPPRLEGDRTTGFAVGHVTPLLAQQRGGDDGDEQLVDGVKTRDVWRSIGDPITAVMKAASLDLRIPLSDPEPVRKAVFEHCSDGPLKELGATLVDKTCRVPFPNLPSVQIELSMDGNALKAAWTGGPPGPAVEPTAFASELAATPWQLALYGRGSLLGAGSLLAQQSPLQNMPREAAGEMHAAIRALAFLDELGFALRVDGGQLRFVFGLRTAWSNPDDVVAKLLALDPDQLIAGKADTAVKSIVDAAPSSPLAGDVHAGYGGLIMETAVVGAIAAVAIPAFLDYMKRSKHSEAELQLNKIGHNLKRVYGVTGAFPIGDAALLPAGGCCGQPGNKCAADPAAFAKDKIWSQIDFSIDEPTLYQFRYHSDDGKTAMVQAVGDLDCDGNPAIFTGRVSVGANGNPTFEIEPPPAGVY